MENERKTIKKIILYSILFVVYFFITSYKNSSIDSLFELKHFLNLCSLIARKTPKIVSKATATSKILTKESAESNVIIWFIILIFLSYFLTKTRPVRSWFPFAFSFYFPSIIALTSSRISSGTSLIVIVPRLILLTYALSIALFAIGLTLFQKLLV